MTVSSAINVSPNNEIRDMSAISEFIGQTNSTRVDSYRVEILDLSNVEQYNSGQVSLSPIVGSGFIITHEVPAASVTNNATYKWRMTLYDGSDSAVTREFIFKAFANPIITFDATTSITSVEHTFTDTYTQANDPIDFYRYRLINVGTGDVIDTTDNIQSAVVEYTFNSYVNGETYYRELSGRTSEGNTFSANSPNFSVTYTEGQLTFKPSVTLDNATSIANVSWAASSDISGTVSGGSVTYDNDDGVEIPNGVTVTFSSINAGENFSIYHVVSVIPSGFDGDIINNASSNPTYSIGYDNLNQRFYLDNNGYRIESSYIPLNLINTRIEIVAQQYQFYLRYNDNSNFEKVVI